MTMLLSNSSNHQLQWKEYEAALYIITVVIFYCIGGVFLICNEMTKKHKHRWKEEEQVQSYMDQRIFIEKQAKVDQMWRTDIFLQKIITENSIDITRSQTSKMPFRASSIQDLVSKSSKNKFSIPPKFQPYKRYSVPLL